MYKKEIESALAHAELEEEKIEEIAEAVSNAFDAIIEYSTTGELGSWINSFLNSDSVKAIILLAAGLMAIDDDTISLIVKSVENEIAEKRMIEDKTSFKTH